mmetsp:Transcript_23463/g.28679  ORF Transcript_23463/g.28679 Transcript_23463/m.28679 type:complete len:113 (-) Transcript_23463:12-350(-)
MSTNYTKYATNHIIPENKKQTARKQSTPMMNTISNVCNIHLNDSNSPHIPPQGIQCDSRSTAYDAFKNQLNQQHTRFLSIYLFDDATDTSHYTSDGVGKQKDANDNVIFPPF